MPERYHSAKPKKCNYCEKPAKRMTINGRNKGWYRTCGSDNCFTELYKMKSVAMKGVFSGKKHPRWIKDRSKLKLKRGNAEWKWFRDEIMKERNYTCEVTGVIGRNMNVHHIKPVCLFPELMYDKKNCVLILEKVHRSFHKKYGYKGSRKEWNDFVKSYGC